MGGRALLHTALNFHYPQCLFFYFHSASFKPVVKISTSEFNAGEGGWVTLLWSKIPFRGAKWGWGRVRNTPTHFMRWNRDKLGLDEPLDMYADFKSHTNRKSLSTKKNIPFFALSKTTS